MVTGRAAHVMLRQTASLGSGAKRGGRLDKSVVRGRSTTATIFDVCGRAHIACDGARWDSWLSSSTTQRFLLSFVRSPRVITDVVGQLVDGL